MTLRLRLSAIEYGANDILLFEFSPVDSKEILPAAEPGSHIDVHLPNGMVRQYSLLNSAVSPSSYRIGVKKEIAGRGGSKYMHDSLSVGEMLEIGQPKNLFSLLETSKHYVLIAGGIGVTPIYNMLNYLRAKGMTYDFYYACRSRNDALFLNLLADFSNVHQHFDDEAQAFFEMASAIDNAPAEADFYCCGPAPMLASFQAETSNIPEQRVHFEAFVNDVEALENAEFEVVLAKSNLSFGIEKGKTILQVLLGAGMDVPFSCEQGVCGECETPVLEGEPEHRDLILSEAEHAANNKMMICCSGSKTRRLVLDL